MPGKVVERDKGFKEMMRRLEKLKRHNYVEVGIFSSAHVYEASGVSVADIAAIHEFGSADGNIPQRSFIRATFDEQLLENRKLINRLQGQVLLGKISERRALQQIGEVVSKQMVSTINNTLSPPLKAATIKRKKSSQALIDTGHLKGAITYQLRDAN